ncbi:MAG: amidase [Dehalococcoidia bacterium]
MAADNLHYATLAEAARKLRLGETTSTELTQMSLDRIAAIDPQIFSFCTVTADLALEQAARADAELKAGQDRGPMHGIPIGLKDLYCTAGIATTGNSRLMKDFVPAEDATVVTKLYDAGAVLLGKQVMHEFAFGAPGKDSAFPAARNPWNVEHIPGGSSSGTGAALAAGLGYGGLGSDTGGSIRGPAHFCGIVGHKPTFGLVSRAGVLSLSWSLDHAGPMARTVEDTAIMLQAIAGYDAKDAFSVPSAPADYLADLNAGVSGITLGVPQEWLDGDYGISDEVRAAFNAALDVYRGLGATIVAVESDAMIKSRNIGNLLLLSEAYSYHENDLKAHPELFGTGARNRFREGAFIPASDYVQAQRARKVCTELIREAMKDVDAVLLPSGTDAANRFDHSNPEAMYRNPNVMMPANVAGLPAVSVPCGFSANTLPIGMQVIGRAFEDAQVLRIAQAYEQATDWHNRHPDL